MPNNVIKALSQVRDTVVARYNNRGIKSRPIIGYGNKDAKILIILDQPHVNEIKEGKGDPSRIEHFLKQGALSIEDVYVTYLVKCPFISPRDNWTYLVPIIEAFDAPLIITEVITKCLLEEYLVKADEDYSYLWTYPNGNPVYMTADPSMIENLKIVSWIHRPWP